MPDSLPYTPALEGRTLLDEMNHRIKNELASGAGRRLHLMPMGDPTPSSKEEDCYYVLHTGETTTTGAFCAVVETNDFELRTP